MINKQAITVLALVLLWASWTEAASSANYLVGTGIADVTGPAAQANMMGMAQISQVTAGIQLRLFARAFVFADLSDTATTETVSGGHSNARSTSATRLAFVSVDIAFVPGGVTRAVVERLREHYGSEDVYSYRNIMLSATHTHSGPGGYSTEALYDLTSFGFLERNFECIVDGITQAIIRADNNRSPGRALLKNGRLYKSNAK
jgi:neutral ceramidase